MTYWAGEAEVGGDLKDVNLNLAVANSGQTVQYEACMSDGQNDAFNNITRNSQSSQVPYRRDHASCRPAGNGATGFRPNPRRREKGTSAGVFRAELRTNATTVHHAFLPNRSRKQSCRNCGCVRK